MFLRTHGVLVLSASLFSLAGCSARPQSNICANGACDEIPQCELGICAGETMVQPTSTRHSMNAAVFDDDLEGVCPFASNEIPPLESLTDDSSIPEFNRRRARRTNMDAGEEFLQEFELHQHLLTVQSRLYECLDLAACYDDQEVGTGELDFQFELEPDGRVTGVSVQPSAALNDPLVRACARRSLFESQFPSWDGGRMIVSYSVEIEET